MKGMLMRKLYDFSDSTKNQYANRWKKQIAVRIDEDTIDYFKEMAETKGIPYQSLINLYLRDSAADNKELKTKWE